MLLARGLWVGCLLVTAATTATVAVAEISVVGSSTVNPVVAEAAELLRAERGMKITVDSAGGSSGGIAALGDGRIDVAMSSRPLTPEDAERFPERRFESHQIGSDALALVVSRDVWEAGIRSISRQQMQAIYEGRVRRWSELGGPDRRIAFFNKEPGRGTWEVFARWLYGDPANAPLVSFPEVGANEEARTKVATTRGGLSQLSAAWADGEQVFALAIEVGAGELVRPEASAIAAGRYPLSRPLLLITDGPPDAEERQLIDLLRGDRGQQLLVRNGYLPLPDAGGGRGVTGENAGAAHR